MTSPLLAQIDSDLDVFFDDVGGFAVLAEVSTRQLGVHLDGASLISIPGQPPGVASTNVGSFATRLRAESFAATPQIIYVGFAIFIIQFDADGKLQIQTVGPGGVVNSKSRTVSQLSVNTFYNFLLSWNLNGVKAQMLVDDVDDADTPVVFTDSGILYDRNIWNVGSAVGLNKPLIGDIVFAWFDHSRALDWNNVATRREVFNADGTVALDPNGDGSVLGVQPLLYFAGAANQWHINKGSAGGTWDITGELAPVSGPVKGIFSENAMPPGAGDETLYSFRAKRADLQLMPKDGSVTIDGVTYVVRGRRPHGDGTLTLIMDKN